MKKFLPLALLCFAVAGCVSPQYQSTGSSTSGSAQQPRPSWAKINATATTNFLKTNNAKTAIANTQEKAKEKLKDPNSAQFRNVRVQNFGDLQIICGEMNAKNSFGGYVGFKKFMGDPISGIAIEDQFSEQLQFNALWNSDIYSACGR